MNDRDLDALVAEKVMGWTRAGADYGIRPGHRKSKDYPGTIINDFGSKGPHDFLCFPGYQDKYIAFCGCEHTADLPDYSTDISSAWLVVEKIRERYAIEIYAFPAAYPGWKIRLPLDIDAALVVAARDESLPRAICLAALKSVGVEVA